MKKLRYIAMVAVLAFALLMTGCFDSPGEDLIGTWVSAPIDVDGTGPAVITIEVTTNPFHLGFLVAHAYAYNAKVTYGLFEWIIPIPDDEQRDELLSLLTDSLTNDEIKEEDLPDFPAFGWACVSIFGNVIKEMTGVYYPAEAIVDDGRSSRVPLLPSLFMQGNFTAGTGFVMEVTVGGFTPLKNVEFKPASAD